jgi:hypothetical protein
MNPFQKYFAVGALTLLTHSAFALTSDPSLGSASSFAVLSAAPGGGGAVTCTDAVITGDVGSSGKRPSVVTTRCSISGSVVAPVSSGVVADFNSAYAALEGQQCNEVLTGTLAGRTLAPGVYCFPAAATLTGTLTLKGSSGDTWLFKVGTGGTGALTGTNFNVVMDGGDPCSVTWWVAEAATMTTSNFIGTVLSGAAITATAGSYEGRALSGSAVTVTGGTLGACTSASVPTEKGKCNQGVGNGDEGCDPGNSNQGNQFRSNDELGGVPGNPGRKGGNKK